MPKAENAKSVPTSPYKGNANDAKPQQAWTPDHDRVILDAIRDLVKQNIWAKVKDDPLIKERSEGNRMASQRLKERAEQLLKPSLKGQK